jgi:general stress protein CsbA
MNLAIFLYLVDILHNVGVICIILLIISSITLLLTTSYYITNAEQRYSTEVNNILLCKTIYKLIIPCWIVVLLGTVIIPKQKTMYLMAGAYAGEKMIQSETGNKVLTILNVKLDAYVDEITKKVETK